MKTICNTSGTMTVFLVLKIALTIIFILVPIIIIINASINMVKAVKSGKDEDIKNCAKQAIRNIVAGLIVVMIPTLFTFIFDGLVDGEGDNILACVNNASIKKVNSLKEQEQEQRLAEKKAEDEKIKNETDKRTEEEKAKNDATPKPDKSSSGSGANLTGNAWVNNLLSEAKKVTDYARENGFTYGDAPINPAINHDAKLVSCDRCVGWFLYNVGYTDQPESHGIGVGQMGSWLDQQGFQKITSVSNIQPGDVVFVNPNSDGSPQHVFLLGNFIGDGIWERYDCGSVNRIQLTGQYSNYSSQPFHEPVNNFIYAYRSPKAQ